MSMLSEKTLVTRGKAPGGLKNGKLAGRAVLLKHGFTLVELMVVLGITAILAAFGAYHFFAHQTKAKHAVVKALLHDLSLAQENYHHSVMPPMYAQDMTRLITAGFIPSPNVMILILYSDGINWLAKARYIGTQEVFTFDSANGGIQPEADTVP